MKIVKKVITLLSLGLLSIILLIILRQVFDISVWKNGNGAPDFKFIYNNLAIKHFIEIRVEDFSRESIKVFDDLLRTSLIFEVVFFFLPTILYFLFWCIKDFENIKIKFQLINHHSKSSRIKHLEDEIEKLKSQK